MAAPAAAAAPVYIGGVALAYGFLYATSPEFRRAHNSLGEAMAEGAGDAVDTIGDLIFGEEETAAPPVAGTEAGTQSGTDTARCPVLPYIHYTDAPGVAGIMTGRIILPGLGGGVYLTNAHFGPVTVWNIIFIGNPLYAAKSQFYVRLMADCTAPIALRGNPQSILPEYFHPGPLRERPPHVLFVLSGANGFPEHPDFSGMSLP